MLLLLLLLLLLLRLDGTEDIWDVVNTGELNMVLVEYAARLDVVVVTMLLLLLKTIELVRLDELTGDVLVEEK